MTKKKEQNHSLLLSNQENKLANIYCLHQIFFTFLLWVPIFYQAQKLIGLSDQTIFGIQGIYYFAFFLFEIPTGAISDSIGHGRTVLLASIIIFMGNIFPLLYPNDFGFLGHFLLIALARSLYSGSASALLYNFLQQFNHQESYKTIESKARSWSLIAKVGLWPLAGFLCQKDPQLPYIITAFASLISIFWGVKLQQWVQDSSESSTVPNNVNIWKHINHSYNLIKGSPTLLLCLCQGTLLFLMQRLAFVQFFGPYLEWNHVNITHYGTLMAIATLFEAIGARKAPKFNKHSNLTMILICTVAASICFYFFVIPVPFIQLCALFCFSFSCGIAFPIAKQFMNDAISRTEDRATILSFESLINRCIAGIATLILAQLLHVTGIKTLFLTIGTVSLIGITVVSGMLSLRLKKDTAGSKKKIPAI
ncbi:MFS transporter [Bacteriovoracaceae bacterium]|nr:MFS transporter [Bacteriovoracaceae bacterium]